MQVVLDTLHGGFGRLALLVGKRFHLRVREHIARRGQIAFRPLPVLIERDHGRDIRVLPGKRAIAIEVARHVLGAEKAIELFQPSAELT